MERHHITRRTAVIMAFFISALSVLALTVYTAYIMRSVSTSTYGDIEGRMKTVARFAAVSFSANELEKIVAANDVSTPEYTALKAFLAKFCEENEVLYAYYMRDIGGGYCRFIADNDYGDGSVGLDTAPIPIELETQKAFNGTAAVTALESYSPGYEHLLSAFAPVYNEDGRIIAVAGVDTSDNAVINIRDSMSRLSAWLEVCAVLVLVCGSLNVYLEGRTDKARVTALKSAVQASRAKGAFLSNMSHEMRTPMNAIIGMTALAKAAVTEERRMYCLSRMEEASTHLLGVINDVLDMSKIEAGKLELSIEPFKLSDIIARVQTVNAYRVEQKKQKFIIEVDDNIPRHLIGDDQRLTQVIMNLVGNAVKFTPNGGEVRLSARLDGFEGEMCRVKFTVADSGIGISPEVQTKLFGSFEQADSTTSRKFGGTGLGLAISKSIVELMDGEIWIESELGAGAAFIFTVLLAGDTRVDEVITADYGVGDEDDIDYKGFNILVVEDMDINREIAGALLEPSGANIMFAVNGLDALSVFTTSPDDISIIFMDVQMPEMDGYEATRRIRATGAGNSKTVPIVAMTANVFKEDITRCLEAGMNDHTGKPLDMEDVFSKLRKYLRA